MIEKKKYAKTPDFFDFIWGKAPWPTPATKWLPGPVLPRQPCRTDRTLSLSLPTFRTSPKIPRVQSSLNMPTRKPTPRNRRFLSSCTQSQLPQLGLRPSRTSWLLILAQLEDANSLSVNCPLIPPKTVTTML